MTTKNISKIIAPPPPHFVGDGFRVHNFIPGTVPMQRMNPFIMLDYNSKFYFSPTDKPRGVGVHPHKGFETVTIAYKGKVAHHDSTGSGGIIHEGDVQWMTAGSGILHKEFHEENWSKQGGDFQVVQLWVNLPAKYKNSAPKYQNIPNNDIHKVPLADDKGVIEVIAGNYNGTTGTASNFTPIHLYNLKLNGPAKATFNFPASYQTALLVIEGEIKVNDYENISVDHFAIFKNDGDSFTVESQDSAVVLIMSGDPIEEPIAAYGPFVMNTKSEIQEAIMDFNTGKFGYLDE